MVQERALLDASASGLAEEQLSQFETIGQSLASVAPTATPAMVIPLVLAACGQSAWLAYLLALLGISCLTSQINFFARRSSSPGSYYTFVRDSLGPWPGLIAGWSLFLAYTGTAASVTGGCTSYAYSLFVSNAQPSPLLAALLTCLTLALAGGLAYRDAQLSARLMLWIEAVSVLSILLLILWPGHPRAIHWDRAQILLQNANLSSLRNGLVLAIFSFSGFESAASLGAEAAHPQKTIPRAIRLTALVSGAFFIFATYALNIGLGDQIASLASNGAPLELLATLRGLRFLSPILAVGAVVSFFACSLACITAGARTLFALSRDGHLFSYFGRAHQENRTPHSAVLLTTALALLAAFVLIQAGIAPFDLYGWIGTVATYGFIVVYLLVTIAALRFRFCIKQLSVLSLLIASVALFVLALAAWASIDISSSPSRWFPVVFLIALCVATIVSIFVHRQRIRRAVSRFAAAD